jgi:HAD superfamily phosphoserine phosphatase-like hydrolase
LTDQLSQHARDFVQSVVQLEPKLAVFDCDGTLWSGDSGERFFDWELRQGLVSDEVARWARARYADYREGRVSEEMMCGEMVTLHRGLALEVVQSAAERFFDEFFVPQIFPEMRALVSELRNNGCDAWAVSSSNEWIIRAAMKHCGIAEDRFLATAVEVENGRITDRLIRVPSGLGKPKAIREVIQRTPDAAFGNARWDIEMLKLAAHPYAVNPNPDLETEALDRGWQVYWPDGVRAQTTEV